MKPEPLTPQELSTLCSQVASYFPGWELEDPAIKHGNPPGNNYTLTRDGLVISLSVQYPDKSRITVGAWGWPEYYEMERGEMRSRRIAPSDLRNDKVSLSDITVAASRGALVIANEIKRRFLPEYERIFGRCLEVANKWQAASDKARLDWDAICKMIGKDPRHNSHYVSAGGDLNVHVENRSGVAHCTLDCEAGGLRAVLDALKAHYHFVNVMKG